MTFDVDDLEMTAELQAWHIAKALNPDLVVNTSLQPSEAVRHIESMGWRWDAFLRMWLPVHYAARFKMFRHESRRNSEMRMELLKLSAWRAGFVAVCVGWLLHIALIHFRGL